MLRLHLSTESHLRPTRSRITGRTLQHRSPLGSSQAAVCVTRLRSCMECARLTLPSEDWTSHRRQPFRRREAATKSSLPSLKRAARSPNKQLGLLCYDEMLACPTNMCVSVSIFTVIVFMPHFQLDASRCRAFIRDQSLTVVTSLFDQCDSFPIPKFSASLLSFCYLESMEPPTSSGVLASALCPTCNARLQSCIKY